MASKIYTKTGDLGKTSLIGGTKIPKSAPKASARRRDRRAHIRDSEGQQTHRGRTVRGTQGRF